MTDEEIIIQFDYISSCLICSPHPTSLRSATFSAGEGFCTPQGEDSILPLQTLSTISPREQNKQLFRRNAFRNIPATAKQATFPQKRFSKNARGARNNRFPCCRERRDKRGESFRALSSLVFLWLLSENTESDKKPNPNYLLFFSSYFLKIQKVTKKTTQTNLYKAISFSKTIFRKLRTFLKKVWRV